MHHSCRLAGAGCCSAIRRRASAAHCSTDFSERAAFSAALEANLAATLLSLSVEAVDVAIVGIHLPPHVARELELRYSQM